MKIIEFNSTKCRHCYKCVRNCEVKAITVRSGRAEIIGTHCILCGWCLQVCPQSAKTISSEMDEVKAMIAAGDRVVLTLAPSYMGLLKFKTLGQVRAAMLRLGFADVRETSEGAAVVTKLYVDLIREGRMENIITTCCPSVNELIEMYHPSLVKYLAPVVTPMVASGMIIKKKDPDAKVVFVGPCIAKKREAHDDRNGHYIDAVITFRELKEWLQEEKISIEECEDIPFDLDPQINRLYPVTGGVLKAVHETLVHATRGDSEEDRKYHGHKVAYREDGTIRHYRKFYVHGVKDCIDLCRDMEEGGVTGCIIEMNTCADGCIKGPTVDEENVYKYKVKLDMDEQISRDPVQDDLLRTMMEGIDFHKEYLDRSLNDPIPTEEELRNILVKIGKYTEEDELNCGACGYRTCRDKATAVFQGKAELDMCIPYIHQRAESMANVVMNESPNSVIIVDRTMRILEYSAIGEKFYGVPRALALKSKLSDLFSTELVEQVFATGRAIHGRKVEYPEYQLTTLQNIVYIPRQDCVLMTIIDVTSQEEKRRAELKNRAHYMDLAQQVIREQMITAQQIASLLGETTAVTKSTLTMLCDSITEEAEEDRNITDADPQETANRTVKRENHRSMPAGSAPEDYSGAVVYRDGTKPGTRGLMPQEETGPNRENIDSETGLPITDVPVRKFKVNTAYAAKPAAPAAATAEKDSGLDLDIPVEHRNPSNPVRKFKIVDTYSNKK